MKSSIKISILVLAIFALSNHIVLAIYPDNMESKRITIADTNHVNDNLRIFLKFEVATLYLEAEGLNQLSNFINNDSIVNLYRDILLIPFYCIEEYNSNHFIGVDRAKIIHDELLLSKRYRGEYITIKDLGTYDYLKKSCDETITILPAVPLDRCSSGVLLIAQKNNRK
jgi:hypothetical protein